MALGRRHVLTPLGEERGPVYIPVPPQQQISPEVMVRGFKNCCISSVEKEVVNIRSAHEM
jgi:hypothetical protein